MDGRGDFGVVAIRGRRDLSLSSRRQIISRVRSLADPVPVSGRDVFTPYSPAELGQLWTAAGSQPSPERCRNARILLALGAGAGLSASEIAQVRAHDVRPAGAAVVVRGRTQRWMGGPGPKRRVTVLGLLVGLHLACAASGGQRVHLAEAARILGWRIPAKAHEMLGITGVPTVETACAFEALEGCVRRLFHDIEKLCDPSPLPKNQRLRRDQAQQMRDADDPQHAEQARQLLTAVCNQILEAALAPIRPYLMEGWDGSCAVDGTAFATFARGVKTAGPVTATDPDAGWYVRDGDHRDPDTTPGSAPDTTPGSGKTGWAD